MTFGEVDQASRKFAAYLQSLGLKQGARVAIMMPNVLQYPIAAVAILRAGYVLVNVNPLYTARELEHQLKDSGSEVLIILENFAIRRKANSKLFYALLEYQNYFNKFFKAENTFEEILDWKDFSPLEYYNKVFNLFLEQLINLHPDTIKLMEELIVKSFPLIQISLKNEIDKVEVMKDSGSIECLILTDFISEITEQLKKINGMNDLDNI